MDLVIVAGDYDFFFFFCHLSDMQDICYTHFILIFLLILEQHRAISVETKK